MPASRIAEAYIQVVPRVDGVATQLRGQMNTQLGGLGAEAGGIMGKKTGAGMLGGLKGTLTAGAVLAAGAAVFDFLKDSTAAASNFAEQSAAVSQVFGKATGDIIKFAEGGATALGQSKTQVMEAAKQFGIYGQAAGLAGQANADFSTEMVQLATDLASFNNTSVDQAIQAIGSGLRGEAEPLRQYGVLLDDATLRSEALSMGLIATTKDALTPQQKVLAAHAAILKQTSTQQGDFSRTSDGLANSQRILTAEFENMKIAVGTPLLGALAKLAKGFSPVISALTPALTAITTGIAPILDVFGTLMTGVLTPVTNLIGQLAPVIESLGKTIAAVLLPPIKILSVILAVVGKIIEISLTPVLFILKTALDAIAYVWTAMANAMDWAYKNLILPIWEGLKTAVQPIVDWFQEQIGGDFGTFFSKIGKVWDGAYKSTIKPVVDFLATGAKNIGKAFADMAPRVKNVLDKVITPALRRVKETLGVWVTNIKNGLANAQAQFNKFAGPIIKAFKGAFNWLKGAGKNIINGLLSGMSEAGKALLAKLPAPLRDALKGILNFGGAVAKAWNEGGKKALGGATDETVKWVKKKGDAITGAGVDAIKKTGDAVGSGGAGDKAKEKFRQFGKDLVDNLVTGMKDSPAKTATLFKNVTDKIKAAFKDGDITASAKKNALAVVSAYKTIMMGIATQIEETNARLADAQTKLADLVTAKANYMQSVYQMFSANIKDTSIKTAEEAMAAMREQIAKSKELLAVMTQLKDLGLSGELYQQILDSGNLDLAKSILDGGSAAVEEMNKLAEEANKTATELGQAAAGYIYDAQIGAAQAYVDGIVAELGVLEDTARKMALAFVKTVNAALGGAKVTLPDTTTGSTTATVTPTTQSTVPVVTPVDKNAQTAATATTVIYNAAPNVSLDAEQELIDAMRRAKVVTSW